ncbi:hypothetical protein KAR91_33710 [Candidatus Pacearchaeota archaeon]|nr:hypothetical protein [Candidatus Pacearchaeota archaeon]
MEKIQFQHTSVAADTDGIATAAVCTGAGPWVPDVAAGPADGLGHLVTITQVSATNHAGKTAAIVGTDASDNPLTETLAALPNGAVTVTGVKYFKTVTSITPSATIGADTMTAGFAAGSASRWHKAPERSTDRSAYNLGLQVSVVSGSPNFGVEITVDGKYAVDHATIAAKTATISSNQAYPIQAFRVKLTVAGEYLCTALLY